MFVIDVIDVRHILSLSRNILKNFVLIFAGKKIAIFCEYIVNILEFHLCVRCLGCIRVATHLIQVCLYRVCASYTCYRGNYIHIAF